MHVGIILHSRLGRRRRHGYYTVRESSRERAAGPDGGYLHQPDRPRYPRTFQKPVEAQQCLRKPVWDRRLGSRPVLGGY